MDTKNRILSSLLAIMTIVIGGYAINEMIKLVINDNDNLSLSNIFMFYLQVIGGVALNIGAGANVPILFIFRYFVVRLNVTNL